MKTLPAVLAVLAALLAPARVRADELQDALFESGRAADGFAHRVQSRPRPEAETGGRAPSGLDQQLFDEAKAKLRILLESHRLEETLRRTYPAPAAGNAAVNLARQSLDAGIEAFNGIHPYLSRVILDAKGFLPPEELTPAARAAYDECLLALRRYGAIVLKTRVPA